MQNNDIEDEILKLNSIGLDKISGARLMNRFEVKYVFTARKITDLVNLLSKHYQVLEINKLRILPYSTTYLDTPDCFFYQQHARGEFDRHKLRYRTYVATDESFLEIKRRTNKGITVKWRIENKPVEGSLDRIAKGFIQEYLPVSSTLVKQALINQFTRITLTGFALKERITIDFNISFSLPESQDQISLPYLAVAELKREAYSDTSLFKGLIKKLNIYPTGFSKYCVGSALLNDSLKKNALKPKLLLLNKLENECT
jgi:hypothetical protein